MMRSAEGVVEIASSQLRKVSLKLTISILNQDGVRPQLNYHNDNHIHIHLQVLQHHLRRSMKEKKLDSPENLGHKHLFYYSPKLAIIVAKPLFSNMPPLTPRNPDQKVKGIEIIYSINQLISQRVIMRMHLLGLLYFFSISLCH